MSKDAWFREYERLYDAAEDDEDRPTDEELAEQAMDNVRENMADRIDQARKKDQ